MKHKNANGDCDAAIAKAAATVTHVQSLIQEVGSGDEGLGLFGFNLSSAETGFGGWERSRRRDRKQYMTSTWGHGLQKKLENLSAAPNDLDHACLSWKRPSPCFQYVPTAVVVLIRQPSQNTHISGEAWTFCRRFRIPYVF